MMNNSWLNKKNPDFNESLIKHGLDLHRRSTKIIQVNLGKLCNQSCLHCHVDAGPNRTEVMEKPALDRILELISNTPAVEIVDLTGGAPELNLHFRYFVSAIRALRKTVIDRCNLTVLLEPGQEDTAQFLCDQQVQIVSSLPCYQKENVDSQRGKGTFNASIQALWLLNKLGYGRPGSGLELHLVYNPLGASLPPDQVQLEQDYKQRLKEDLNIEFNSLYTITNMPIKRFKHLLERTGQLQSYQQLLVDSFNPFSAADVMCRDLISISWDGYLFDCDFNQMLEIPIINQSKSIWDINNFEYIQADPISFGNHCYGCTAGAGSSCQGALINTDRIKNQLEFDVIELV